MRLNFFHPYRLFPVLLMGLTGLLTVWLDQISTWSMRAITPDPNKPKYVAEQVVAKHFDLQGRVQEKLQASRLWQYPGQDDIFFETPVLTQYEQGVLRYHATGEVSRYNPKTKLAFFEKKATLTQAATAKAPVTQILTSALHLDLNQKIARSQAATTFTQGASHGSSMGFIYQQQQGLLNLLSKVKITYVQPKP